MPDLLIYVVSVPGDPIIRMDPILPEDEEAIEVGGDDAVLALHDTMRRAAALLDAMNSAGMRFPGIYVTHKDPE